MLATFFDTETTGLTNFQQDYRHLSQPDLVQIGCKLVDIKNRILISEMNIMVTPERAIEEGARKAHNFDDALLKAVAMPRKVAVVMFNHFIKRSQLLVAHNLDFDSRVLRTAYFRESLPDDVLVGIPKFCTMTESTNICKIPNPKRPTGYKWPGLMEAYKMLVNPDGFGNAHNAAADTEACYQVFLKLQELGVAPNGNG